MLFEQAKSSLRNATQKPDASPIRFVRPADSVLLAAATIHGFPVGGVRFSTEAHGYADNNGLLSVLGGTYTPPQRGGQQGATYTKLTRLATHQEVGACNAIVNDLFYEQLEGYSRRGIRLLCKVVGELHDNVASHAKGAGFSCAQVYRSGANSRPVGKQLQFAIADAGCGMLSNVARMKREMKCDLEAIEWCLVRGNTTAAASHDSWDQRVPEDSIVSPFPDSVKTVRNEDHHLGEGLWQLQELMKLFGGTLSILSGNGELHLSDSKQDRLKTDFHWQGTAIGFQIFIPTDDTKLNDSNVELEKLAERMGI